MVTGARGDDDEREVVLGRDAGHQGLGAVAAGHAEQVGPPGDGRAGHLGDVDRLVRVEQEHLGAKVLGPAPQIERADLTAAGLGVHDQERAAGGAAHRVLGHSDRLAVAGQGSACRHAGEQPARGPRQRHPQQGVPRVHHDDRARRRHEHRKRQPAQRAAAGQEPVGRRQAHRRRDQAHGQHPEAAHPGRGRDDGHRGHGEGETQPGQPRLPAGSRGGTFHRHQPTVTIRAPSDITLVRWLRRDSSGVKARLLCSPFVNLRRRVRAGCDRYSRRAGGPSATANRARRPNG